MKLVRSAGILALLVALLAPVASVSADYIPIYVHPGESIQAAINKAPAGGIVVVERGTYKGNLDIKRSVRLLGHDAVIVPAAKATKNLCSTLLSAVEGICVHGVVNADFTVGAPVSNVSIEGFTVRKFSGAGMVVAGAKGFRAARDVMAQNGAWGIMTFSSSDVSLLYNSSHDNGNSGIEVDTTPSANAVIVGNSSYGNVGMGIAFADALGGRIELNAVYGNCAGILVSASADPRSTGGGDVSIQLNQVTANNHLCPAVPNGMAAYGGFGIVLIGARNSTVALNDVRDNVSQIGSSIPGGGILLLDGALFGVAAPSGPTGDSIRLNWLSGNTPNDIYGDGTGTTNTISGNSCTITNLTGAC